MASLIGSIIDVYASNSGTEAVALRTALGTGKMDRDRQDTLDAMPYCVVSEVGTSQLNQGKGATFRLDATSIQFDVFTTGAASADAILEALENLYCGPSQVTLSISSRTHMATYFNFRQLFEDEQQNVWHGVLELAFHTEK